jgi:hypothetical protein
MGLLGRGGLESPTSSGSSSAPESHPLGRLVVALSVYLKMAQKPPIVIPAKAGIQVFHWVLDPGLRRGDGVSEF